MNLYQKVKQRCADVGMSISELERECGFPRGSVAIDILSEGEEATA